VRRGGHDRLGDVAGQQLVGTEGTTQVRSGWTPRWTRL